MFKWLHVKTFLLLMGLMALYLPCPAAEPMPGLSPVYFSTNGSLVRLTTLLEKGKPAPQVAFQAICTNKWLPGLVPVFAVESEARFQLRRRPVRGQEGSSEPLFFALPNPDELEASQIAGRWDCIAVRGDGAKEYLGWELSAEGRLIAGRFDQNTDYRFAHVTGGSFRSNRFELRVEYISDSFVLTGAWKTNRMQGQWRRTDDSEQGTWEATRPYSEFQAPTNAVPLYEWRNAEGKYRYAMQGVMLGEGWAQNPKPLCSVWK